MASAVHAERARWTRHLGIWVALVVLTVLSFLLSRAHLGGLDTVLSLAIAAGKSTLVLLFFMHLVQERFTIVLIPFLAIGYVALLLALMASDVLGRHTFPRTPAPFGAPIEVARPPPAGGPDAP